MSSDRFISERKGAWQRLEELLDSLDRLSLRGLGREEVRELGRIYRRTSSDLAIARAESRDPRLVNYLNSLVIRAHGRVYRAEPGEGWKLLKNFFVRDFPTTFRRTWRYTALTFAVFLFFAVGSFLITQRDTDFAEFGGVSARMRDVILNEQPRWWEELNDANQVGASFIAANNTYVTFRAFAFGALFGVGTLFDIAYFGIHVGSILALTYRAGFGNELVTFMSAHGVLELSCVFIAGGAGVLVGTSFLLPGDLSRLDALRIRGREAVHLVVGCVPVLAIAGIIEGFISPAAISPLYKYAVAILTGIALYAYLTLAGREATDQRVG